MRQWRVGTLSMGILLVALGAAIFIAQINQLTVIDLAIKWWPLIFVILGVEVLAQVYINKNTDHKVKYDIFSIFIVFIIVISGLCIQGLTELGLTARAQQMIGAQDYVLQTQPSEIELADGVKRLVIDTPNCQTQIYTSDSSSILAYGTAIVTADSRETAANILSDSYICNSQISGDTQFISFDTSAYSNDLNYGSRLKDYRLVLPDKVEVIVEGNDTSIKAELNSLNHDWSIKESYQTELSLSPGSNLGINALVRDCSNLRGNIDWISPEPSLGSEEYEAYDNKKKINGKYEPTGTKHYINVISDGKVVVNQL